MDWAHDEVIMDAVDLVEKSGVSATWFITHQSPVLERLRSNPNFELGIHPNFNFLLKGDFRNGKNAEEVIDRLLKIVPEARSVRSHSLVQSTVLSCLFFNKNLRFESNLMIPESTGYQLRPYLHTSGMIVAPYCWGDHHAIMNSRMGTVINHLDTFPELRIVNFHPIHIYINTEKVERYESTRNLHQFPQALLKKRYTQQGVRTVLEDLLKKK